MTELSKIRKTLPLLIMATCFEMGCSPKSPDPSGADTSPAVIERSPAEIAKEALKACDDLAADPNDPGRYSAGVADDKVAPGAAIEACTKAVELNKGHPRATFQLGRVYWVAHKDDLAFDQFFASAQGGYGPAMKGLGDAYLEGRGLPKGEEQDAETALSWYKRSDAAGYPLAKQAIKETTEYIASITLNPSFFQNSGFIKLLHSGKFEQTDAPVLLAAYTVSFVETLDSEPILFVDQECKPLVTKIGTIVLDFAQFAAYLTALKSPEDAAKVILSHVFRAFSEDQGKRDAIILINKYGCTSPVTQKIIDNIIYTTKAR